MAVETKEIFLNTSGNCDVIDITDFISEAVRKSKMNDGIATIFVPGATGGLTTIEYESGLIDDIKSAMTRLIPEDIEYKHNLRWGDGNGHSHIRSSFIGPSITVPFVNKRLTLGTWQQIIFLDFDNCSRNRKLIVQIMGE